MAAAAQANEGLILQHVNGPEYVATVKWVPVGRVKDYGDEFYFEVEKGSRNRGFGTQIVRRLMESGRLLKATVVADNAASHRIFTKLGWCPMQVTPGFTVYVYVP